MAINDYCTAAEVKVYFPNDIGTNYDTLLAALIPAACRAIDLYTNRKPGAFFVDADVTRYYKGDGTGELFIDDLAAAPTSLSVAEAGDITDYTAWASTDYMLFPYNATDDGQPFFQLNLDTVNGTQSAWPTYPKGIKIIGKFGYAIAVPDEVKQASIVQVINNFKRAQQAYRDRSAIIELGEVDFTKSLDPEVILLIKHLRKMAV